MFAALWQGSLFCDEDCLDPPLPPLFQLPLPTRIDLACHDNLDLLDDSRPNSPDLADVIMGLTESIDRDCLLIRAISDRVMANTAHRTDLFSRKRKAEGKNMMFMSKVSTKVSKIKHSKC